MQHDGALQGAVFHGPAPLRAIAYNRGMNAQLGLLVVCQSLYLVNNITFIAINGLVGLALAPQAWMATLPIMGYVLGGALSTGLVARTQRRSRPSPRCTTFGSSCWPGSRCSSRPPEKQVRHGPDSRRSSA